jgi:hypothetical protein
LKNASLAPRQTIDFASRPSSERPEAVQAAAELFIEHGCVLLLESVLGRGSVEAVGMIRLG